jgi:hypothetical protein
LIHLKLILIFNWTKPLKAKLNPVCYLPALLAHHILHVSRIRVKDAVMASCALHNFLQRISRDIYTPSECFDIEGLENGTVTAGLRSHPSSTATLKKGK